MNTRVSVALYVPDEKETAIITCIDEHSRILTISRRCADLAELEAAATAGTIMLAVVDGANADIDVHLLSRLHSHNIRVVLTRVHTASGEQISAEQLFAIGADRVADLDNPLEILSALESLAAGQAQAPTPASPHASAPATFSPATFPLPSEHDPADEFEALIASIVEEPPTSSGKAQDGWLAQAELDTNEIQKIPAASLQQFPPRRTKKKHSTFGSWWVKRRRRRLKKSVQRRLEDSATRLPHEETSREITYETQKPKTPHGRVVAVVGTSGAPGRTTTAIHLAACLGRDHAVAVLDADTQAPSVAHAIGIPVEGSSLSALARVFARGSLTATHCEEVAYEVDKKFSILTGLTSPHRWREADPTTVKAVIKACRQVWDYTFVDVHAASYEPLDDFHRHIPHRDHLIREIIEESDAIVLVSRADALGLHRLKDTFEWLEEVAPDKRRLLVANMADSARTGAHPAHAIAVALSGIAPGEPITVIPYDSAINRALLRGRIATGKRHKNALAAFQELAQRVETLVPPQQLPVLPDL